MDYLNLKNLPFQTNKAYNTDMSLFGVPAADDGLNPVVRIVINNIVSKRFGLTKAEVSGLTIEEKARLIKSTFSEAEIKRLLEEEVNRFFAPFKSLLHLFFPALAECEKKSWQHR